MCGIAGYLTDGNGPPPRDWAARTSEDLRHRGPDDFGLLTWSGQGPLQSQRDLQQMPSETRVALLHRRLSILDLSEAGWQPFCSEDRRFAVTFNGEIYNYVELRDELRTLGHRFRSDSDTEVLLAAYRQWGAYCLRRFVGMFAFALLDTTRQELFLARDFFGIKPLYYSSEPGGFQFASELKPLTRGRVNRAHPQRMYDYLCYGKTDHGEETLIDGLRQLPAAHCLTMSLREPTTPTPVRYWNIEPLDVGDLSFEEAAEQVRTMFLENVRLHLRSDVPVGAALSGGIDSSSIVMAMRAVGGPQLDLQTFSFIADDARLSEESWVDIVARAANAKVHKIRIRPEELMARAPNVVRVQQEPFGSTSICAQNAVFERAAREGIKVMLDGQGADEMLAGYRPFLGARLASLLRGGSPLDAARFWMRASRQQGAGWFWLAQRAAQFVLPPALAARVRQWVRQDVRPAWLDAEWFRAQGVSMTPPEATRSEEMLRAQLIDSVETLSLPHLLRYEDRNSMAWSIESRVPFLTPDFVTFILSLPESYLIAPDGTSKAVFRAAMRGLVPDAILDRRDKIGFATPEQSWLTTIRPWVDRTLAAAPGSVLPGIDFARIQDEWNLVASGGKPFTAQSWRWLNMCLWAEETLGPGSRASEETEATRGTFEATSKAANRFERRAA